MDSFKIGQICTLEEDYESETWCGEKVTIKNGGKCIIGADGFVHYIGMNVIQPLGENQEVSGYDHAGLAEWILRYVKRVFPEDILEDLEISDEEIQDQIEEALVEIL